jgi:hypothetical protein
MTLKEMMGPICSSGGRSNSGPREQGMQRLESWKVWSRICREDDVVAAKLEGRRGIQDESERKNHLSLTG